MARPPLRPMPNPYTLSERSAAFYERKAAEGIHPTDLAVIVLRNEEERRGEVSLIPKEPRPIGRPKGMPKPKTQLAKQQLAMKIRIGLERAREFKAAMAPKVELAVHAETELPPVRIVLSYEECMARKAW